MESFMKKMVICILIAFLLIFTSCSKKNNNKDPQPVENVTQNTENIVNQTGENDINNKVDDNTTNNVDDEKNNQNQDNIYIDLTMYNVIDDTFEYEIIDFSDVEYSMLLENNTTCPVYIAYIKINHYFEQDLVNNTDYELSSYLKNTIEYTQIRNQQYEEICSSEEYKEHPEMYKEEIREMLFKMAIQKEDLNYFVVNESYIGHLYRYRKVNMADDIGSESYVQVIDMTNIGYSFHIKDNQLSLEGLSQEQLEKMKNANSILHINNYLPKEHILTLETSKDEYVNWLIDIYNYRKNIRQYDVS